MARYSYPFYDTSGVPWIENILVPELRWGDGGNYETWYFQTQSGVRFGGRRFPWRGAVPFCEVYLPRSPENMCALLRTASVTFAFGSTVWRGLKLSCTPTTPAVTSELIGPMATGMVGLINIFCFEFLLVM